MHISIPYSINVLSYNEVVCHYKICIKLSKIKENLLCHILQQCYVIGIGKPFIAEY